MNTTSSAGRGMGVAALVLGILAVLCSFIPCFGIWAVLFGALAVIFGGVGLSQASKGGGSKGMPRAGLVLGILATAFVLIWMLAFAGAVAESSAEIEEAMQEINAELEKLEDQP